jgi:hypothetical protein
MATGQSELSCGMRYKKKMRHHQEVEPTYKMLHTPTNVATYLHASAVAEFIEMNCHSRI